MKYVLNFELITQHYKTARRRVDCTEANTACDIILQFKQNFGKTPTSKHIYSTTAKRQQQTCVKSYIAMSAKRKLITVFFFFFIYINA